MDCHEVRELLYAFLDGKTGLKENLEIQEHLDRCEACGREYLLEQAIARRFKESALWEEAPPQLRVNIEKGIKRIKAARLRTWHRGPQRPRPSSPCSS